MNIHDHPAPGGPGRFSPWTSGGKTGVGRALNSGSEVSFTVARGILNEVYFPREDVACIRDCGFLVTDGKVMVNDERTQTHQRQRSIAAGVPAYLFHNSCREHRYHIHKRILADPRRDAVLQHIRLKHTDKDLHFYLFLTPHLHNQGEQNEAWIDAYKDMPMLFARGGGLSLALACDRGWRQRSVGFIGVSDGYTDILANQRLTHWYTYAGIGNVALCAEPETEGGEFVIAIGFGHTPEDAAHQARSSLLDGFGFAQGQYMAEWKRWHSGMEEKRRANAVNGKYLRESLAALRISESRRYPGGIIASLAVPWGEAMGVNDGMGYHLVWPRDLVESAWGFLAVGAEEDALRILNYLWTTQDPDGKWSQNMWLDGRPDLTGVQMDQTALPLLLLESCHHRGLLTKDRWQRYLPGVIKAVAFLVRYGPYTGQDRWEQQAGLSPFTLAAQVAALLAAAALFDRFGEKEKARYCRETADHWNERIETWTYVRGTELANRYGVDGYYVRINPFFSPVQEVRDRTLRIRHRPEGQGDIPVGEVVSPDALALVRFGLRRPNDPRILDTIRVVDGELKKELPGGPCWRRFTGDAYGEDDQGRPFAPGGGGMNRGRCWPLLTGERAHYEIAAGNIGGARRLFKAMEQFSFNGLLPEQVWDAEDLPEKGLYKGRYTGSAMPLTWAQAEYVKLAVSLKQKKIADTPAHTARRYIEHRHASHLLLWRFDRPAETTPGDSAGHKTHLRLELLAPARVRWSADGWVTVEETPTRDTGLGIHYADLPLTRREQLAFTFYWIESNRWEGTDFRLHFPPPPADQG